MARFQWRRNTAAGAASNNAVLAAGEPGITTDTHVLKVGDGATAWIGLPEVGSFTYVPIAGQRFSALPKPFWLAHRGYGFVAPEDTSEAIAAGKAAGVDGVEYDVSSLTDGTVAVFHDLTINRLTTLNGNVADLNSGAFKSLVLTAGTFFGGSWGNLTPPLLEDILQKHGNSVFMNIDFKASTNIGPLVLAALRRNKIHPDTVLIDSYILSELAPFTSAGYQTMFCPVPANYATYTPAVLTAAGVNWVCYDITWASLFPDQASITAEVARWHAVGIKVQSYSHTRRYDTWPWRKAGVDMLCSNEPIYHRDDWVPRSSDPWEAGNFGHGQLPHAINASFSTPTGRGSFTGPVGTARWLLGAVGTDQFAVQGWGSPIAGAIQTTLQTTASAGATSITVGPENKPLVGAALVIDRTGTSETVTPTSVTANIDGTFTCAIPALASSHTAGVKVQGGAFTIQVRAVYDALGADTTRWPAIIFGQKNDLELNQGTDPDADNGYMLWARFSGANFGLDGWSGGAALSSGKPSTISTQAIHAPLVLSAGLTAAVAVTSFPVNSLAVAVPSGMQFMLPTRQVATVSSTANIGDTTVAITSITPTTAIASATSIPQTVPWKVQRTATQIIATRLDTNDSLTWTNTALFGGYWSLGQSAGAGISISWSDALITTP
jgi:glycerophosphoryl diester phosphodiesterase